MIKIPQPAIAVNSLNAPGQAYSMWSRYDVGESFDPSYIMNRILSMIATAPEGRIRALVLNCHGFTNIRGEYGYGIELGTGIDILNVGCFKILSGKIDLIVITACGTSRISASSTSGGDGDGHYFTSTIARLTRAKVVACTEMQVHDPSGIPPYHIDEFEGLVTVYNENGQLVNQIRHPSTYYLENLVESGMHYN